MCSIIMLVCGSAARDVGDYHLDDDEGTCSAFFFILYYYTPVHYDRVFFFLATHLVEV